MTILTFPTLSRRPSEVSWRLAANTQTHESPLDRTTQTLAMPGARWAATVTWSSLPENDRRTLDAFLAKLGGRAGRFTFSPNFHAPRRATGGGSPVMNGSIQTGSSISIVGWSGSAQAFRAGDFLSYEDASGRPLLHMVTADVSADGTGTTDPVPIAPPVRRSVANGTPIEINNPVGLFMLTSDDQAGISVRPPLVGSVTLDIIEALV